MRRTVTVHHCQSTARNGLELVVSFELCTIVLMCLLSTLYSTSLFYVTSLRYSQESLCHKTSSAALAENYLRWAQGWQRVHARQTYTHAT